jgi:Zn-dependent protease
LILILAAVEWGNITGTAEGALFGVVLMLSLFTCVILHELGHSLVAMRFGIPVREITLLPLGGVAQISKNPEKPIHELLITLAGPAVNVVIAIILWAVLGGASAFMMLDGQGLLASLQQPSLNTLLTWLLAANVTLVVFNMIPAFPLDGGRVLRSLLAMVLGYRIATRIASTIGQVLAIALGVYGLVSGNIILVLIAVFVFFGATQETAVAESKTVLTTQRVGDAYNKHALTLAVGDRVSKAVDYLLTSYQPDFAVMQGSNLLGVAMRNDILRSMTSSTTDSYVTEVMQRDVLKVDAAQTLQDVLEAMNQKGTRVAAVYTQSSFMGLVSMDDISEAFAVLSFQERQKQARENERAQANQMR